MGKIQIANPRERGIYRITLLGSIVNLLLMLAKFLAGTLGRSSALIADAIHSLSDFLTDIIVICFVRISSRPQDEGHDYGHGKFETLATLIIGVVLLIVGVGICVDGAKLIADCINGRILPRPALAVLIVAAASIVLKELLYQITIRRGRKLNSKSVIANAWHHRSDALSSIGTLIGVAGAIFLGERWRILDPIAAVVVSAFIIKAAIDITRPAIDELLERSLPAETEQEITSIMTSTPGVIRIHRLRTRRIGACIAIEAHVKMAPDITLTEAHVIASEVERRLRQAYGPTTHIGLHMEPA